MKRILFLIVIICLACNARTFARLGQTEDEVAALFGKSIDPGQPDSNGVTTNMYQNPTGVYLAIVQFLKGHSISESYARVDSHPLSEKELSAFLQGNSGGKEWKKDPHKQAWERSDHHANAWCETLAGRPTLLVTLK